MSRSPFDSRGRQAFLEMLRLLGPGDDCVIWPGSSTRKGKPYYRRLWIDGLKQLAHRWVYAQVYGPIPDDLFACHTCDNPPCVRPSHLWLGTCKDNLVDAARKGHMRGFRGPYPVGEKAPNAKFSDVDIVRMRSLLSHGVPQHEVARTFGISKAHISRIAHGESRTAGSL